MPGIFDYRVVDGGLFHPRPDSHSAKLILRAYVPEALREKAIRAAHTSAHVGYDATVLSLERFVYWPGFRRDTKALLGDCLRCKQKASQGNSPQLGVTPTPLHPWHTVGIDILQLPRTKKDNKYLLVLVDILTRYAVAVPLREKSAA